MWEDGFFDSLNICFEIMRFFLFKIDIYDINRLYIEGFMMDCLLIRLGY